MASNRPESIISIVKAIAEFTLMVFGIIGIATWIFNDKGLLKQLIDKLMNSAFSSSVFTILAILVVIVLAKVWYNRVFSTAENANALGNFMMKAMMMVGAYFIYLYLTTGSFRI